MIAILAIIGALVVGLLIGLIYRGHILIGDRRGLNIMTQDMLTEARRSAITRRTLADMRRAAADHFQQNRSA